MPESRNRPKHHQHHTNATHTPARAKRSAALVVAILAAFMGFVAAYFARGLDATWLLTGTAIGAILGYFVGAAMDKGMEKKSTKID